MSNLGVMTSVIQTELHRGTSAELTQAITRGIERAIKFYRARRLGFNLQRANTTINQGAEYIALPTDFIEVDHLRLQESSSSYCSLIEKTFLWIEGRNPSPDFTSQPLYYALQNRELRVYPRSDATYVLQMSYLRDLQEVSISATATATNDWMTEGEQLIREHAKADVLKNYIRGAEAIAEAATCMEAATAAYNELKRRANREQSTGRTEPNE